MHNCICGISWCMLVHQTLSMINIETIKPPPGHNNKLQKSFISNHVIKTCSKNKSALINIEIPQVFRQTWPISRGIYCVYDREPFCPSGSHMAPNPVPHSGLITLTLRCFCFFRAQSVVFLCRRQIKHFYCFSIKGEFTVPFFRWRFQPVLNLNENFFVFD